jgi:hypothetical protein
MNWARAGLVLLALFGIPAGLLDFRHLRQFPADLLIDDLEQRDIRRPKAGRVSDKGPTAGATPGIQLPDAPGDEVYQNVGVANLLQCFFTKFSVQSFSQFSN